MGISNRLTQIRRANDRSSTLIPPRVGLLIVATITVVIASFIGTAALALT